MRKASWRMITTAVLAAAVAAASAAAAEDDISSGWAASPPRIDGKADEWQATAFTVWKKGDVHYAFRNDGEKLYVLLIFKNPKSLSMIGQTGIRLYFNAAGKKSKDYAVHFVRRQVPVEEAIAFAERDRPLSEEEKAQLRTKPAYNIYDSQVQNKKAKSEPAAPSAFPPAHFRFAQDQKTFVYEFEIPLVRGDDLAAGVGAAPGESVMVGFEWGNPTEEQLKRTARVSGEAGIANEEASRGRVERMAGAKTGPRPPKYTFWASVRLAEPGNSRPDSAQPATVR